MTNLNAIQAGGRITAGEIQGVAPYAVIKGADQVVGSSTTLINDNALLLTGLPANTNWLFGCFLNYEAATSPGDIKWNWVQPAGATMRYTAMNITTAGVADDGRIQTESTVPTAGGAGAGQLRGVFMKGTLFMGGTAGTLQLQWAQNTSSATQTIVHAQSSLELWRIA